MYYNSNGSFHHAAKWTDATQSTHFSAIRNNFANFYLFCTKMRFGSSHIPSCCSSNAAPQHEPWLRQQEVFSIFASCFL